MGGVSGCQEHYQVPGYPGVPGYCHIINITGRVVAWRSVLQKPGLTPVAGFVQILNQGLFMIFIPLFTIGITVFFPEPSPRTGTLGLTFLCGYPGYLDTSIVSHGLTFA
eukprot:3940947-Rhodomonas_salina.5